MTITEKVVKNAGSHRILHALYYRVCTSKELKNIVGAINSISKFDGEYMARLQANAYVVRCEDGWWITDKGRRKYDELGPARGMFKPGDESRITNLTTRGEYKGVEHRPVREGAEDFLKLPSRIGNLLHYRDGRTEKVNDDQ